MLSQLRRIEERFGDTVAVVGVHTAKYPSEKETFNIRQAVLRHDVRHPVVNDRDFLLWRAYAARAWPTIVIISPDGRVVGAHAGEFDTGALTTLVEDLIRRYAAQGMIDRRPLDLTLEEERQVETVLAFPGKLLADPPSGRLYVSDTEHHSIGVIRLSDGRLLGRYGSGEPGFSDGGPDRARFRSPQGLSLRGDGLFVADTGNHGVRRVAVQTGVVTTVAGTGHQASPWPEAGPGRSALLNSPWDVLADGDWLYVAMAGSHQIWVVHLPTGRLESFAGDGKEGLHDGPRLSARLAQPSGLASDGRRLWFVDSETSSVRCVPLLASSVPDSRRDSGHAHEVKTVVGHGLFEFGDVDGETGSARLQHALGLAFAAGCLYVADSYNNKIKVLDLGAGEIRTLAGCGEPGLQDGPPEEACFWEPGGLAAAGDLLWIADTNNHAIRAVDRRTGQTRTLDVREAAG